MMPYQGHHFSLHTLTYTLIWVLFSFEFSFTKYSNFINYCFNFIETEFILILSWEFMSGKCRKPVDVLDILIKLHIYIIFSVLSTSYISSPLSPKSATIDVISYSQLIPAGSQKLVQLENSFWRIMVTTVVLNISLLQQLNLPSGLTPSLAVLACFTGYIH